jgi:hypothetical protein
VNAPLPFSTKEQIDALRDARYLVFVLRALLGESPDLSSLSARCDRTLRLLVKLETKIQEREVDSLPKKGTSK